MTSAIRTTVSDDIARTILRLWDDGRDSLTIAEAVSVHWPDRTARQVEPFIVRILARIREERRQRRIAG